MHNSISELTKGWNLIQPGSMETIKAGNQSDDTGGGTGSGTTTSGGVEPDEPPLPPFGG